MGWLSLLKIALSLANTFANIVRERGLINAGVQQEVARNLKAIADSAGIARAVEAETAKMTPDQILRDLEGAGELRD